jgi:hypothetical protein
LGGMMMPLISGDDLKEGFTPTTTPTPTVSPAPRVSRLAVAVPNLSHGGQPIQFRVNLESPAPIELILFSISGEQVFEESVQGESGLKSLTWNLQNNQGGPVASGLYIYLIKAGEGASLQTQTGKVVILR